MRGEVQTRRFRGRGYGWEIGLSLGAIVSLVLRAILAVGGGIVTELWKQRRTTRGSSVIASASCRSPPESNYYVLRLACSIRTEVRQGRFRIQLGGIEGQPAPIAVALKPSSSSLSSATKTISAGISLGPGLQFALELDPSNADKKGEIARVRAMGLLTSAPEWELRGTRQTPLCGAFHFMAVIKTAAAAEKIRATAQIAVERKRQWFGGLRTLTATQSYELLLRDPTVS